MEGNKSMSPVDSSSLATIRQDIVHIFTYGSWIDNKFDRAIVGIGIYFGEDDARNISESLAATST